MNNAFENKLVYKNIVIDEVIALLCYSNFISLCYKLIFRQYKFDKCDFENDITIIYSHRNSKRNDYDEIINNFYECVSVYNKKLLILKSEINLIKLIKFCLFFLGLVFDKKITKQPNVSRAKFIFLIAMAKVNIDEAELALNRIKTKLLVTFCDVYFEDNILAQLAKSKGILTLTLQHGQYHIIGKDIPENLALNNIVSDYFFAWGQATIDEYNVKVKGCAKLISAGICLKSYSKVKNYIGMGKRNIKSGGFNVFLNADNCFYQNKKMIEVVSEYCSMCSLKFSLKYHPKNRQKKYLSLLNGNENYTKDLNDIVNPISIVYTSGVLVKLLANSDDFFLFKDDETPDIFKYSVFGFSNIVQLKDILTIYEADHETYLSTMEKTQRYFIAEGDSCLNYNNEILNILKVN